MMLRNVTSRTVKRLGAGTGMLTEFTLDCGHRERRNGELLNIRRILCSTCSAAVAERTQRELAGR